LLPPDPKGEVPGDYVPLAMNTYNGFVGLRVITKSEDEVAVAKCPPKKLGAGQFYLATFLDSKGQRLRGGDTCRLRVPGDVPVKQFWAVTVYDHDTCALIRNAQRVGMDSYDARAIKNADGSIDTYFGPKTPAGKEANWVPTLAEKTTFPLLPFLRR
jgi:hypothetical protein